MSGEDTIEVPLTEEEVAQLGAGETVELLTDDTVEQRFVKLIPDDSEEGGTDG